MKRITTCVTAALLTFLLVLPAGAGGAWADSIEDVNSVVAMAPGENFFGVLLAEMHCDKVKRVTYKDGSALETQTCDITGPFDGFGPEFAGGLPDRPFKDELGECIWVSDYLGNTTGEVVFANSYKSIATPSGKVHVTSRYSADPLTEEDCGAL